VDGVIAAGSAQLVSYSADQKGVVINVHLFHAFFHERLQKVIADYNDELRKPDSWPPESRSARRWTSSVESSHSRLSLRQQHEHAEVYLSRH
jgi:hypothetical protein